VQSGNASPSDSSNPLFDCTKSLTIKVLGVKIGSLKKGGGMENDIKAIVFKKPGDISIEGFSIKPCGAEEMVVKTLYTMVSSGTELRVLSGEYGASKRYPLIPGYSVIGEVIEVGSDVHGYEVGDIISGRNPLPVSGVNSMWGGQASHHLYRPFGIDRPVLLPRGAEPSDYVISEISAISLRGVKSANPLPGETAVVLGQGLIGAFSASWLFIKGCRVIVADIEQGRLDRSHLWGASAAVNIAGGSAREKINPLLDGGADIVVESSGTSEGILTAYQLIKSVSAKVKGRLNNLPRLVVQANYVKDVSINPFSFYSGEGMVILSPMDRDVEDRQEVVEAIRTGKIRSKDFVQNVVPFRQAPSAYKKLRDDRSNNFSLVYDWAKN
jgi:2-desacetyl-2-hydroxyethyl bacteriochlorophyllide A dehydrogenase